MMTSVPRSRSRCQGTDLALRRKLLQQSFARKVLPTKQEEMGEKSLEGIPNVPSPREKSEVARFCDLSLLRDFHRKLVAQADLLAGVDLDDFARVVADLGYDFELDAVATTCSVYLPALDEHFERC